MCCTFDIHSVCSHPTPTPSGARSVLHQIINSWRNGWWFPSLLLTFLFPNIFAYFSTSWFKGVVFSFSFLSLLGLLGQSVLWDQKGTVWINGSFFCGCAFKKCEMSKSSNWNGSLLLLFCGVFVSFAELLFERNISFFFFFVIVNVLFCRLRLS